jgi:hypothetical protein
MCEMQEKAQKCKKTVAQNVPTTIIPINRSKNRKQPMRRFRFTNQPHRDMKAPMKVNLILAAGLALATAAQAAPTDAPTIASAPKNLARQHLGANLMLFSADSQTYAPTEAAAAWLDDDIATGWPAQTGKQDYLVALPEPALINNFAISAKSATGTVTLYAGDEAAPPGAKSWTVLEKDVPIDSINEKLGKPFGRFAKYILIETNLTDSGPWYSIYLYGDKDASAYHLQQRAQPVDPRTVFGPYTNPETSISVSSLYAHSKIMEAGGDATAWNNSIDDNPATGTFVAATTNEAGLAIKYDRGYAIQRVSVLTDPGTKGKLELFVLNQAPQAGSTTTSRATDSQFIKVANTATDSDAAAPAAASPIDLSGAKPVQTINFDGTNPRASVDFTPTSGTVLEARWTPEAAGQPLNVREINSFGDVALNDYELSPDQVAEAPGQGQDTVDAKGGDGKEALPADGKEPLPPAVGEDLPAKTAFIPGVPVFPPNIPFSP